MTERANSIKKLRPTKRVGIPRAYLLARIRNIRAEINSIIGYCVEISVLQNEHLPLKKIQEKMGILCQGFSVCKHVGQCEEPKTTLSSFGILL